MCKILRKFGVSLALLMLFSCQSKEADFVVTGLEYSKTYGLSNQCSSNFSWKIKTENYDWVQGAYQIIVSDSEKNISNDKGDFWDSGKKISEDQLFVPYQGKPFVPGEKYFWKVRVWEKSGKKFRWSNTGSFSMQLTYPGDWKARWITYDYHQQSPMPLFRKSFELSSDKKPVSARLYVCGLGYYEAYLNGSKIGDRVLEPAQTNYDDYAFYSDYEIPVKELGGKNVLGIMVGNGWYNQYQVWNPAMAYGQPIAIAQLSIKFSDGSTEWICTDDSWKWNKGPVTSTNIYAGESYDANLEIADWSSPSLDDGSWNRVSLATNYPPGIFCQDMEPIRRMGTIPVVKIVESSPQAWLFDFGQNFAGWTRLKIQGKKGQKITLRFAEEIDKTNQIDPTSTGVKATKVVQTDSYTCKGTEQEIWEPRFTYHGFRYVEVTGLSAKPENDLLTGIVVYSSMPPAGTFTCSDAQINRLHEMAVWTIKSNMHSIPTDCPHRERCGWTGDAHAVAPTLIQNLGARQFLTKYLFDMRSSARLEKKELYFGLSFHDRSIISKPAGIPTMIVPGKRTSGIASPDWGTAATQIPWYLYQYYGDINALREFYPDMKTWVDYIANKFPDFIVNHGLGDWCPPGGNEKIDCPVALSSTAFHFLDLTILTKTAHLLGYTNDGMFYSNRMNKVKEQFNAKFFDPVKGTYGGQTANAMAIQLGLVPDGKIQEIVQSLVSDINSKSNGFLQTGIFGLGRLFPALAENGQEELVYNMLTKKGEHSFSHMWDKYNATTLWEILPVDDSMSEASMNSRSHSHPMNAGYDEWFFRGIGGIHQDENGPGYKNVILRPYCTSKLKNATATYESPYGTIVSDWKWEGTTFCWDIQIPANSGADIYIPKLFPNQKVSVNNLNDKIFTEDPSRPGYLLYKSVGSGKYSLKVNMNGKSSKL